MMVKKCSKAYTKKKKFGLKNREKTIALSVVR